MNLRSVEGAAPACGGCHEEADQEASRRTQAASPLSVLRGPDGLGSQEDHPDFPLGILRRLGP